ncbi:hypothetical protein KI387_029910, partial [Taxus chinensis]
MIFFTNFIFGEFEHESECGHLACNYSALFLQPSVCATIHKPSNRLEITIHDLSASALNEAREQWEYHRRPYPAEFYELDPCAPNLASNLPDKSIPTDIVCCLRNLQDCFGSEDYARSLLQNVSSLLKPGGYFFGITADSSTIWSKYQKAVEGAMKAGSLRVNGMLPRVRTEHYVITFEDDRFTPFGMKYQLQFSDGLPSQAQLLVHFPSLIGLATEVGLEYVEIQNMLDFYEDHRSELAGILQITCGSLQDNKGRLSHRTHDVLSLFTTFIFQKRDHFAIGSMSIPSYTYDRTHPECSDPMVDSCSECVAVQIHDTQSLFDSGNQHQLRPSHFSEMTSTEVLIPNNSYSHLKTPSSTYDGNFHGDLEIWPKNCDDAIKHLGCAFCEKAGSVEEELLNNADLSPQRELCNMTQNGKVKQNSRLTQTHVRFDLTESHDDHSGTVSPEKSLGLGTDHEKKSVDVKVYSRSNGNHRKYSDRRLPTFIDKSQETETAYQHINSEKSQQGNDLQHLKSEKKITPEKRPNSILRDKRDAPMGSHHTFSHDRRSSYDE